MGLKDSLLDNKIWEHWLYKGFSLLAAFCFPYLDFLQLFQKEQYLRQTQLDYFC